MIYRFHCRLRGAALVGGAGDHRVPPGPGEHCDRALVTGGASPIGAAICRRLAADGLHVIIHAHASLARPRRWRREIQRGRRLGRDACLRSDRFRGDRAALRPVLEAGVPQMLVHNAGTHEDVPLAGMTEAQWRGVLDVTLNGFYAVTRPLLLPMMATRWGRIVAISSLSALMGNRGQVNYAAAKAGLIGAVRSLSHEVASARHHRECGRARDHRFAGGAGSARRQADRRDRADATRRKAGGGRRARRASSPRTAPPISPDRPSL